MRGRNWDTSDAPWPGRLSTLLQPPSLTPEVSSGKGRPKSWKMRIFAYTVAGILILGSLQPCLASVEIYSSYSSLKSNTPVGVKNHKPAPKRTVVRSRLYIPPSTTSRALPTTEFIESIPTSSSTIKYIPISSSTEVNKKNEKAQKPLMSRIAPTLFNYLLADLLPKAPNKRERKRKSSKTSTTTESSSSSTSQVPFSPSTLISTSYSSSDGDSITFPPHSFDTTSPRSTTTFFTPQDVMSSSTRRSSKSRSSQRKRFKPIHPLDVLQTQIEGNSKGDAEEEEVNGRSNTRLEDLNDPKQIPQDQEVGETVHRPSVNLNDETGQGEVQKSDQQLVVYDDNIAQESGGIDETYYYGGPTTTTVLWADGYPPPYEYEQPGVPTFQQPQSQPEKLQVGKLQFHRGEKEGKGGSRPIVWPEDSNENNSGIQGRRPPKQKWKSPLYSYKDAQILESSHLDSPWQNPGADGDLTASSSHKRPYGGGGHYGGGGGAMDNFGNFLIANKAFTWAVFFGGVFLLILSSLAWMYVNNPPTEVVTARNAIGKFLSTDPIIAKFLEDNTPSWLKKLGSNLKEELGGRRKGRRKGKNR